MIEVRPAAERGITRLPWLRSMHTFSFNSYVDSRYFGFGPLRVINEDLIQPSNGFQMHFHRDMEIVTYVMSGQLEHHDSLGNGSVIRPGQIQAIHAGSGIMHSEFNCSKDMPTHLLQIWIRPDQHGVDPGYQQEYVRANGDKLHLLVGPRGEAAHGSAPISIHQDARVYLGRLRTGEQAHYALRAHQVGWVQMLNGEIAINGNVLQTGDGAGVQNEHKLAFQANASSEFLLFDMVSV